MPRITGLNLVLGSSVKRSWDQEFFSHGLFSAINFVGTRENRKL